jgi:hypothetical protein
MRKAKVATASAVIKQILAFADKQAGKRFFVSAVAFEAHTPYIYHQGTTEHYYDGPMDPAIGTEPRRHHPGRHRGGQIEDDARALGTDSRACMTARSNTSTRVLAPSPRV